MCGQGGIHTSGDTLRLTYFLSLATLSLFRMNFFGLLTFNAPYLPWVLLGFSLLLGNSVSVDLLGEENVLFVNCWISMVDILLGMAVGHCYYFMEDIFPQQPGGWRILKTPHFLRFIDQSDLQMSWHSFSRDFHSLLLKSDCCVTRWLRIRPTSLLQRTDLAASNGARWLKDWPFFFLMSFGFLVIC